MKVVSLINMKGGVGKTTLSVNICNCIAKRHNLKVLLVDIDPQFNATQCLLTPEDYVTHLAEKRDTILNVFDRAVRPVVDTVEGISEVQPKVLSDVTPIEIHENFYLLPGNLELFRVEMSSGEGRENRLNKYLQELARKDEPFDIVIIDTPPTPSIWMTSALLASNYYLIPVKPDPISLTGIDLLRGIVNDKKDNFDLSIECCGLVLTMVEDTTLVYQQAVAFLAKSSWAKFKYARELPKRTAIARTQMSQQFILDLDDTDSKSALVGIVDEFLKRIK